MTEMWSGRTVEEKLKKKKKHKQNRKQLRRGKLDIGFETSH